jgi:hypothetical protein
VTVLAGFDAATQIVGRADVNVVVAQLEKIDMPRSASLPALPGSFGRRPSPVNIGGLPPEARKGEGWRRECPTNYWFSPFATARQRLAIPSK